MELNLNTTFVHVEQSLAMPNLVKPTYLNTTFVHVEQRDKLLL